MYKKYFCHLWSRVSLCFLAQQPGSWSGTNVLLQPMKTNETSICASPPPQRLLHSLSNLKDVGIVQVKVMRAEGLMAADVNGELNAAAKWALVCVCVC